MVMSAHKIGDPPVPRPDPGAGDQLVAGWPTAAILGVLIGEHGLSHAEIARRFQVRPVVIAGLVWRYGLGPAGDRRRDVPSAVPSGPKDPVGCRYITGDVPGLDWRFCQAPQIDGSNYCGHHHAICHDRGTVPDDRA